MKRITSLTIGLIIFSIGLINAQTTKGKVLLELSSDILGCNYMVIDFKNYSDSDPTKYFSVNLSPKIGYFLIDNLPVGLNLNTSFVSSGGHKTISFDVGPFVRYYIPTPKVLPFFELGSSFGLRSIDLGDSDNPSGVITYGGGLGLAIPLKEKIMIDVLAGYNSQVMRSDGDTDYTINSFGVNFGFTVLL